MLAQYNADTLKYTQKKTGGQTISCNVDMTEILKFHILIFKWLKLKYTQTSCMNLNGQAAITVAIIFNLFGYRILIIKGRKK